MPRQPPPFWSFLGLLLAAQALDLLVSRRVAWGPIADEQGQQNALDVLSSVSNWAFAATLVVAVACELLRVRPRLLIGAMAAYLAVATLNLLLSVLALVATAQLRQVERLSLLWDVGLVYLTSVIVFALWYRLLDGESRGQAIEFPVDPSRPERLPGWIDYVFLSFNTNATFGPTAEIVHAPAAKLLMMVQTTLSLLVLVVLLARIAGLS